MVTITKDTDKVIKAQKRAHNLLITLHDYVDSGSNTFIHQLCENKNTHSAQLAENTDCAHTLGLVVQHHGALPSGNSCEGLVVTLAAIFS